MSCSQRCRFMLVVVKQPSCILFWPHYYRELAEKGYIFTFGAYTVTALITVSLPLLKHDAFQDNIGASQDISAALKDLMAYYDQVQGSIQELKDDLAILRKEKRDFQEDMRSLEQKANEQGEALVNIRGLMESELKSTKESISAQLGRVIVFHDEIQEHKKRIADLESKVAKQAEELETLRHRENGHVDDVSLL